MNQPSFVIRRATAQDAPSFARIMGHPDVLPGLMQVPYTSTEIWQQRLAENLTPARADHLSLVAERAGHVVGTAGLHPAAQLRRRHVAMLGISVAAEAQSQGVGSALMQALCSYADDWAQILRIELTVFVDNERAIALYRKFGFETEGRHRGYAMRSGAYIDVFAMARWHPRPPALAPEPAA
jgi:putative acetyltransferase